MSGPSAASGDGGRLATAGSRTSANIATGEVVDDRSRSDPGAPPYDDLLPRIGEVAISRATYESIYLVEVPHDHVLKKLDAPIDLGAPHGSLELYQKPAEGVIVTTEQEWIPRRVGLGRLLHSLTLAPGESTRMAVVDWSRQVTARTDQTTAQAERVAEAALRTNNTSEITNALAVERQQGSSTAKSLTSSTSAAGSVGVPGFGGSASTSVNAGLATNVSRTDGSRRLSTSTARDIQDRTEQLATSSRELRATAVVETSEVEAAAASTRVVTNYNHMHALTIQYWEVIQEYRLRTRTKRLERCLFVPMKVLTFTDDVFRRYKAVLVAAAPDGWKEIIDGVDPFQTSVYRTRSSNGASDEWSRSGTQPTSEPMGSDPPRLVHFGATTNFKVKEADRALPGTKGATFLYGGLTDEKATPGAVGWDPDTGEWVRLGFCTIAPPSGGTWYTAEPVGPGVRFVDKDGKGITPVTDREHVSTDGVRYRLVDGWPTMVRDLRWTPATETTPGGGAERLTAWWDETGIRGVKLAMLGAETDVAIGEPSGPFSRDVGLEPDERVTELVMTSTYTPAGRVLHRIALRTDRLGVIELGPEGADDRQDPVEPGGEEVEPHAAAGSAGTTTERLDVRGGALCGLFGSFDPRRKHIVSLGFQISGQHTAQRIIDHLDDNRLHYSRAIWANADELSLTRILANFAYDDGKGGGPVPLGARLDPVPVAMTGNYLGFRWHFPDAEARDRWSAEFDDPEPSKGRPWQTTTVSLGTDGVFAEAVLGRSNGAEKLDITRFWDWQTSPIPILPSEIAPVDTGSRARDVAPETGQLAAPAASTRAMPNLPEPTGTAVVLQALAAGNLFRDMSGLEATSALLQKGIEVAAQSEGRSAEQATTAMKQANEHMERMSRIAVDAAKEVAPLLLGPAGAAAGALGNSSKLGALLNLASNLGSPADGPGE
jgi:hypothetical protein